MRRALAIAALAASAGLAGPAPPAAVAASLEEQVGRSEVRVLAAPYQPWVGQSVADSGLARRLEAQGYVRVHRRPERPGEFFWGHDVFRVYRRPARHGGRQVGAERLAFPVDRASGRITALPQSDAAWLEPVLLSESLAGDRAPRRLVELSELPEIVWRAVLAAEDARFFDHPGVDARSLTRAALRNLRAGKVVQGGSTITQQLVKNRDLQPRRRLGRKVSEAVRALALEAEHSKEEILQAYLNSIYLGHVGGLGVYGVGAASRAYFGKPAARLGLGEAALVAALIQGPNRLHPGRHPERALERQRWVLGRLAELGWASTEEVERARRAGLPRLRLSAPPAPPARHLLDWVRSVAERDAGERLRRGRGLIAETTLDPYLQRHAEATVGAHLERLARGRSRAGLSAALVALDARSGAVLAYVGGDPRLSTDRFDRARKARRQPGSSIKPLVALEALADCGAARPLYASRRIVDGPVRLDLPAGPWEPSNPSGRYLGVVDLRRALVDSLNTPFVRVGRHCGFGAVAARFRRAGLEVPAEAPPALVLGAVEVTPLELAAAFTVFAGDGQRLRPRALERLRRPGGRVLERFRTTADRVADAASAYIVRDMMLEVVRDGTGRGAALGADPAWGKTGTSSGGRDAWFVGGAGSIVAAVWLGVERPGGGGLTGARSAAPLWREFMAAAVPARPEHAPRRPARVVERWLEEGSGLLVRRQRSGTRAELFRRGEEPPRRRLLRADAAEAPLR